MRHLALALAVLLCSPVALSAENERVATAPAPGSPSIAPDDGTLVFEQTSRVGRTVLHVSRRPAAPELGPEAIDAVTREGLSRLQKRFHRRGAHPEAAALPVRVPVDAGRIAPTVPPTTVGEALAGPSPDDFVIFTDSVPSDVVITSFRSILNEPTVAIAGDQVLYTANWYAARLSDGGETWSHLNPFTGRFLPSTTASAVTR